MKATRSGWRSHQCVSAVGPLLGAAKLVGLLAGQDHAAVDDPGERSGRATGGHRDHRLVEERQALAEPSEPDQDVALARAWRARTDPDRRSARRSRRPRRRSPPPPPDRRLPPARRRAGAADSRARRGPPLALEQPLGTAEPAAGLPISPRARGSPRSRMRSGVRPAAPPRRGGPVGPLESSK